MKLHFSVVWIMTLSHFFSSLSQPVDMQFMVLHKSQCKDHFWVDPCCSNHGENFISLLATQSEDNNRAQTHIRSNSFHLFLLLNHLYSLFLVVRKKVRSYWRRKSINSNLYCKRRRWGLIILHDVHKTLSRSAYSFSNPFPFFTGLQYSDYCSTCSSTKNQESKNEIHRWGNK